MSFSFGGIKKMKKKKLAVALLAAGTIMFSSLSPSQAEGKYYYEADEATGIEQKVDENYGKVKQIKTITEEGKDKRGSFHDDIVETTYVDENGLETKITVHGYNNIFGPEKIIERNVDGKKIVEEYDIIGAKKGSWKLSSRVIEYDLNGAKVTEWYNGKKYDGIMGDDLNLRTTLVERKTEDGKIIEYHWGKKYYEGKEPDAMDLIKETIIYAKGTSRNDSVDYFENQEGECPNADFFDTLWYDSIERKKVETFHIGTDNILERVRYETRVKYQGKEDYELRVEQDYGVFERPSVDGKFDYFRSVTRTRDGVYDATDFDGDGIADETVEKKIFTINFD